MSRVDWSWFRTHLLDEILPRWLKGACTASGLFLPHLDREWRRTGDVTGTLVSQGRLIYNFAVGYRLTGDPKYLEAVGAGATFLAQRFGDEEHGGFHYRCDWNGKPTEDFKDAYGHAFAVFGLAHAARAEGAQSADSRLLRSFIALSRFGQSEPEGLAPRLTREWEPPSAEQRPPNSQNPVMHAFEACLSAAALQSSSIRLLAEALAEALFEGRDPGPDRGLPELYTEDWEPLPTEQGGRVDLGHQFEWAYLLSRAGQLGHPEQYLDWAHELLDYGMRVGYDPEAGGIFANASLEGEVIDRSKGWWQQCEAARAMMHFAVEHGREELWEPLAKTIAYFQANYIDPEFGGWYHSPTNLNKGSEWKVDYHVVGMCEEAIRLAGIIGEDV